MNDRLRCALTWFSRLIVGSLFIFSGFTKAIDPWGTLYKIYDYLSALHIEIWPTLVLSATFGLIAVEFSIGVFVLTGCFRRTSSIICGLIMAFMLPLTLWIALTDPVKDCGCFGDALIISNWATFGKNVVLSVLTLWLILNSRRCSPLVAPYLQWLAFIATASYIILIAYIGYNNQPMIDFRPYKTGTSLITEGEDENADSSILFIYEKDGVEKQFGIDDTLPDENDGWRFVRRIESKTVNKGNKSFVLWDETGEEDMTEEAVMENGEQFIMLMPDIGTVSIATTWKINSLYSWAIDHGIDMIAVASGTEEDIDRWKDLSMPSYEIYLSDDTVIKEVARGNPAIIYLRDGIIKWKTSLGSIDVEDFLDPNISADPMSFVQDGSIRLKGYSFTYISIMAFLMLLSLFPSLKGVFGRRKKESIHDDKVLHEE